MSPFFGRFQPSHPKLWASVCLLGLIIQLGMGASAAAISHEPRSPSIFGTIIAEIFGQDLTSNAVYNFSAPISKTYPTDTIADVLAKNTSYSFFSHLLNMTGFDSILANQTASVSSPAGTFATNGNWTVVAPINSAFTSLPSWITDTVQNGTFSVAAARALIAYHIHNGTDVALPSNVTTNFTKIPTNPFPISARFWQDVNTTNATGIYSGWTEVPTLQPWANLTIYSNATTGWPYVNDARILSASNATNGAIYSISRIVTPMWYVNSSIYSLTSPPPPPPVRGPVPLGDGNFTVPNATSSFLASVLGFTDAE